MIGWRRSRSWEQVDINQMTFHCRWIYGNHQVKMMISTNNIGFWFVNVESYYDWWKDMKKLVTQLYESNNISLYMNLWEVTKSQENWHNQSWSFMWICRKLSKLMERDQEVRNKLVSIESNCNLDEYIENNKLTRNIPHTPLENDFNL